MTKRIALILTLTILLSLLAGCTGTTVVVGNCTCPTEDSVNAPVDGNALKTGLSVTGSAKTTDGEGKTNLEYDVTIVAVTVDGSGVIQSCIIDSVKATADIGTDGIILTDTAAGIRTENEQGEDYGMKAIAKSKYEWNEQAAAVAEYAVGKTAQELKNGAVTETGHAADADLASTATIYIGGYVNAIVEAANNAQVLGADAGDVLKLAIIPSLSGSSNATTEKDGVAQLVCDVAAVTMNGETITSCIIDSLQAEVKFNAEGKIPEDASMQFVTKNALGEAYGMKAYGNAKYEWNEQAANFSDYVTGKTAAEVSGIAVNEGTVPTDADLASGVTIAIGGFQALIAKAAK